MGDARSTAFYELPSAHGRVVRLPREAYADGLVWSEEQAAVGALVVLRRAMGEPVPKTGSYRILTSRQRHYLENLDLQGVDPRSLTFGQ